MPCSARTIEAAILLAISFRSGNFIKHAGVALIGRRRCHL